MSERDLLDRVGHRLNSACKPSRKGLPAVAWLMMILGFCYMIV